MHIQVICSELSCMSVLCMCVYVCVRTHVCVCVSHQTSSSACMTDLEVILEFLDEHYRKEALERDKGNIWRHCMSTSTLMKAGSRHIKTPPLPAQQVIN